MSLNVAGGPFQYHLALIFLTHYKYFHFSFYSTLLDHGMCNFEIVHLNGFFRFEKVMLLTSCSKIL